MFPSPTSLYPAQQYPPLPLSLASSHGLISLSLSLPLSLLRARRRTDLTGKLCLSISILSYEEQIEDKPSAARKPSAKRVTDRLLGNRLKPTEPMAPHQTEWTPRNIYDGYDEGYGDMDLEDDISYYISSDNAEGLKSLLSHPDVRKGKYKYCRTTLLQHLCLVGALKCATALLDGKLGITGDVNRDQLLHYAARFSSPELVKLFLRYGARTDVPFARKVWWDKGMLLPLSGLLPFSGMLPLNSALYAAREAVTMYLHNSFFNWIVSLFLPSLKQPLVVNKLLVESSNNIEEFAYYYAMEGKLIELAVLLILAREKVLNGRMMIPQCVGNQILSLIDEEVKLMRECKHRELTQIQQKMMGMSSTALLLEVFERAGHTIGEYLQSQKPDVEREQVEKDVALILKEAGFILVAGEFEFSIRDWLNYCGFVRTPTKFLQTLPDKLSQIVIPQSHRSPLMQPTNVSLPRRKETSSGVWSLPMTSAFRGTHALSTLETNQALNSILVGHDQTSFDAQVKKGTKAVEQNMPKCLSREKVAYIAMLVKRGLRSSWFL